MRKVILFVALVIMPKKMNPGVWGGIGSLLFSLVFFIQSFQFEYTSSSNPGPGFFPVWLSGILIVLSVLYIIQSLRTPNRSETEQSDKTNSMERMKLLFVILSMFLFPIVLPFLGFMLSGTIFLFLLLFRAYKWYISLGISIVVTAVVFWLFGVVLSIPLPVNGWGF
jgi:putative tricarboxylic transport membrane protein